jgi:hypothetical protein
MSKITPSLLFPFNLPVGVQSLAFNSSGTQLAIGLQNGTVQVRDFVTGSNPLLLRGHSNSVTSVAFSTDDRLIATASLDGTVRIWDAMTAEEQYRLEHSNTVTSVAFSRDGARLATASRDGTTKLWDVKTGQELIAFFGDGSGVNSLAFNSNGSRLAASSDHEARIYLMQVDDLVKLGQSRAPRRLTDEECLKYLHGITDSCGGNPAVPTITPLPATINGRICQITNSSGLNDNYFNELIYKGIQESAQTHNWEATVLQSSSVSDFSKLVKTFADADCRLIISPGNLLEQLQTAAQVNPNQRFMVMDFGIDPPLENVWVQEYATDQAAFLAGYLSASVTKTGKVGVFALSRPVAFAAACGLATAVIGLLSGGMTYGTGYAESKAALEGSATLPVLFVLAKLAVIWLAFLSRIPGGVFAPALAVGAGLGSDIALLLPGEADVSAAIIVPMDSARMDSDKLPSNCPVPSANCRIPS